MIRELQAQDLDGLLRLYTFLHDDPMPERSSTIDALWQEILDDTRHHIIGAWQGGQLISSCVCVVVARSDACTAAIRAHRKRCNRSGIPQTGVCNSVLDAACRSRSRQVVIR